MNVIDANTLPGGWHHVRVGDALRLQNGWAFKANEWTSDGRPIIRIQNLKSPDATFSHFNGVLPEKFAARRGDLLYAWSGTPGTSFGAHIWDGPDAWINQHIFRVDFSDEQFDRDFLKLALDVNTRAYIEQAQGGVGLAHITKAKLNDSLLPIPPLAQQRLIAGAVRAIEAKRQSSATHLAVAHRAVEHFRQAVLATAYRRAVEDDASEGLMPLAAILREPLKNGYSARPVSHETPFRVLTLTATTSGYFDGRHFKYTDESFPQDSPVWLKPGDIVIQRGNTAEYVGVPALYDGEPNAYIYPDLMIRARVREDIDPRFVWYMLLAPQARQYLRQRATGSAGNMPKINQKVLNTVPVPLPSSATRSEIMSRLDAALDLADRIEGRFRSASKIIDRSSQAVLAKAFRGELVGSGELS